MIRRHECNECGVAFPTGWGGYTYAVDDDGHRVVCPHPCEMDELFRVTGMTYAEATAAGRLGYAKHCIREDCLHQFDLDWDRDAHQCPACASNRIATLRNLIGKKCPRCKVGLIEAISPIQWKLDPDWEQLPVPELVKDLVAYENNREVPESLRETLETCIRIDKAGLITFTNWMLGWWEGEYFGEALGSGTEQHDSLKMNKDWTWCTVIRELLPRTPALAELVVIHNNHCWFAPGVTADTRRGMKNYIRKYRRHELMS